MSNNLVQAFPVQHFPTEVPDQVVVSVVVVTYNHEKYIAECLDSILMQETSFPFEIVLGEDESSDNTRKICVKYATEFPENIRLFLHDRRNVIKIDGNPTGRFNFTYLLNNCQSKYIALCEGDDYWTDPSKLQNQVALLDDGYYSGCFHETQSIYENGELGKIYGHFAPDTIFLKDTFSTTSIFHTSSFIFRNEHLEFPNWFNEVASCDMALFSIICSKAPLIKLPGILSHYRKHIGGLTNTSTHQGFEYHKHRIDLMDNLLNHFPSEKNKILLVRKYHWITAFSLLMDANKKPDWPFVKTILEYLPYLSSSDLKTLFSCFVGYFTLLLKRGFRGNSNDVD